MDAGQGDNNGDNTHSGGAPRAPIPDPGALQTSNPLQSTSRSTSGHVGLIPDLAGLTGESSRDTVFTNNAVTIRTQHSINSDESSEDEAAGPSRRRSMAPSSTSSPPSSPEYDQLGQFGGHPNERIQRRREKNKMAAQRCRQRRRDHVDTLVRETQKLECDNTTLAYQIRQLEKERNRLQFTLVQHQLSCTKEGQQPQFRWVQRSLASQQAAATAAATATATATSPVAAHSHTTPVLTPLAPPPGIRRHLPSATVSSPPSSTVPMYRGPSLPSPPLPLPQPPPPPPRSPQ